jgi:hypothetical protein
VNVHAKSCLTPEPLRALRSETKGQAAACPDRTQAIPCKVRGSVTRREERRAISVQLYRVTSGQSRAAEVYEVGWLTGVTGDDLSNSQADSAGRRDRRSACQRRPKFHPPPLPPPTCRMLSCPRAPASRAADSLS